ncbi:terminase large subunit domain-containing protein [Mucilaginibacter sp. McL0603]|uniref:terminase large subunit domain-containing protein n=1 Tax=Mucilaginibacter sp. McL0603 TaxID=3415670 RepID=UPI003CF71B61
MAVEHQASVLFTKNYQATAHIVINQGGTSSGKTFAIMQVLFCIACENVNLVITVVGQDIPNLKAGALRDALKIYSDSAQVASCIRSYNRSERIFEFNNGSVLEFKSYDDAQDAKSGKRDYLFLNEANGIDWNIYTELALRTRTRISTASIVASVMTSYFQLKSDIHDIRINQETQNRVYDIRLKIVESQVGLLQQQVDELRTERTGTKHIKPYLTNHKFTNSLIH